MCHSGSDVDEASHDVTTDDTYDEVIRYEDDRKLMKNRKSPKTHVIMTHVHTNVKESNNNKAHDVSKSKVAASVNDNDSDTYDDVLVPEASSKTKEVTLSAVMSPSVYAAQPFKMTSTTTKVTSHVAASKSESATENKTEAKVREETNEIEGDVFYLYIFSEKH